MDNSNTRLASALSRFGIAPEQADAKLIRHNENEIYRLDAGGNTYALRIHESAPGFMPIQFSPAAPAEKRKCETELLTYLFKNGMDVQRPVAGIDGRFVQEVDGVPATLLEWLPGDSFDGLWPDGDIPDAPAFQAGLAAGRLDALMLGRTAAYENRLPRYGSPMLPPVEKRLASAHEAGAISADQFEAMRMALKAMAARMDEAEAKTGLTVCHADLSGGNMIMLDSGRAGLIDFSLAGIASPYMDVAGLYASFTRENVQKSLRSGFEAGFKRPVELSCAEPYFALSVLLFIAMRYTAAPGWDWFPDAVARWTRDIFIPLSLGAPIL